MGDFGGNIVAVPKRSIKATCSSYFSNITTSVSRGLCDGPVMSNGNKGQTFWLAYFAF